MRRLFAVAVAACALAAVPASAAAPGACTPRSAPVGACAEYVCVDICGPEIVVTTWCDLSYKICSAID